MTDEDADRRLASRRVADELKDAIESGTYPVGAALPPIRQLAEDHEVAVNTAMTAIRLLVDEGYVTNAPNRRASVRDRSLQTEPEHELHTLRTELTELRAEVGKIDARLARLTDVVGRLEVELKKR